jgi:hypothetical protein
MPVEAAYLSGMNERQADGILKVFDSAPVSLAIIFIASPAGDIAPVKQVDLSHWSTSQLPHRLIP